MKRKFKKLSLKTETIQNLTNANLRDVVGADTINTLSNKMTKCTLQCTFCTGNCSECTINCTPCCPL